MCLATAPRVLLLDEPLAGMGAEETGRMLALLAELKAAHAILLVEHDMDAVFRIADRITVMVNGAVIASDVPGAHPHQSATVQRRLSRRRPLMTTCSTIDDLHTYYGDSHMLRGVDARDAGRATSLGLLGRNGMGKTTLIRTLMGYVRAAGGARRTGRAATMTGAAPERMARLGIGYVPEGRGIFPNLSVRENLVMSGARRRRRPARLDLRARAGDLPAPRPSGSATAASSSRAASSRCSRSAAR